MRHTQFIINVDGFDVEIVVGVANGIVINSAELLENPEYILALKKAMSCFYLFEKVQKVDEWVDFGIEYMLKATDGNEIIELIDELMVDPDLHITGTSIEWLRAVKHGVENQYDPFVKPTKRNAKKSTNPGYVYLLLAESGHYKIGRTSDPENRAKTFGVKLPFRVEYECVIKTNEMVGLEKELHKKFDAKRIDGEWFALSNDDVEYIKSLAGTKS